MSCRGDHFLKQEDAIREKWFGRDIIDGKVEDVDIYFYRGSCDDMVHFNKRKHVIGLPCDDGLMGTYRKTMMCFESLDVLGIEYDYIFRTNCSTMINVKNLKMFINQIKDDEKIYCGNVYANKSSSGPEPYDLYGLGKGLIFSRKWVERILSSDIEECREMVVSEEQMNDENLWNVDDNALGLIVNCWCEKNGVDKHGVWVSYGMMPGFHGMLYNEEKVKEICFQIGIPFRTYKEDREVEFERGDWLWKAMNRYSVVCDTYFEVLVKRQFVFAWKDGKMHFIEKDFYVKNKSDLEKKLGK